MSGARAGIPAVGEILFVHAAAAEADLLADLQPLRLGVGKVAAATTLAHELATRAHRPRLVLLFGVAGAFPQRHLATPLRLGPGVVCVVGLDRFGDEGVATPEGFRSLDELKLGDCGPFEADADLARAASTQLAAPIVRGVTVSTCSGTEATAAAIAARSRAEVETMEGAAVAHVCASFAVPLLHVRAISNWTGDRDRGEWDLRTAARAAQSAVRRLLLPRPAASS